MNNPREDTDVPGIEIEKTRINLFNAIGFLAMFAGGVAAYTQTTEGLKQAQAQNAVFASELARIKEKVAPLDTYAYRQGETDKAIAETNKRIDRVVESMNDKFDAMLSGISSIKDDVAGVKSDVRLLGQKIETLPQRTRFVNLDGDIVK